MKKMKEKLNKLIVTEDSQIRFNIVRLKEILIALNKDNEALRHRITNLEKR